jgi:hypothetical protein
MYKKMKAYVTDIVCPTVYLCVLDSEPQAEFRWKVATLDDILISNFFFRAPIDNKIAAAQRLCR